MERNKAMAAAAIMATLAFSACAAESQAQQSPTTIDSHNFVVPQGTEISPNLGTEYVCGGRDFGIRTPDPRHPGKYETGFFSDTVEVKTPAGQERVPVAYVVTLSAGDEMASTNTGAPLECSKVENGDIPAARRTVEAHFPGTSLVVADSARGLIIASGQDNQANPTPIPSSL